MNDLTSAGALNARPPSGPIARPGDAFFEPISSQWIGRTGEQPVAAWIRSLPNTDAALSMIDRWPGNTSVDDMVSRATGEALSHIRADRGGSLPGAGAFARGDSVVDRLHAESDGVRAGYALGSLAAAIEQRIAEHPGVPSATASSFAAGLRERGAAMSLGAAREATADPGVFSFRGVCYANENAMVGAITRAMNDPNTTRVVALTPDMERAGQLAQMDRATMTAPRSPLGTTWAETGYWIARGQGAGPEGLERARALGATGDALLGIGGAMAGVSAARTGFRAPGAQPGPWVARTSPSAATATPSLPAPSGRAATPAAQTTAQPTMAPGAGAIVVTPRGIAITPEVLGLQGTSPRVGDFRGIAGATVQEIISRVPASWTVSPQEAGMGIRFTDASGAERLRLHGPSPLAPGGLNSAVGWTARVHEPGTGQYRDNDGNLVRRKANGGHIPIQGNPNAPVMP